MQKFLHAKTRAENSSRGNGGQQKHVTHPTKHTGIIYFLDIPKAKFLHVFAVSSV